MYCPPRNLRSVSRSLLCSQKFKTVSYGCRAFSFDAPKLWNSIPEDIKKAKTADCFKNKLKTFLFKKVFFILVSRFVVVVIFIIVRRIGFEKMRPIRM